MSEYTKIALEDAPDVLGDYPGEMRMLTYSVDAEQAALSWRRMPPDTGGRGSYGHSHKEQEEIYLVLDGDLTFKIGDDEFVAGPGTCVRIPGPSPRSVHNDTESDVVLVIAAAQVDDPEADLEKHDDFWPSS
jgi:mannose-6-phosphate isomerase-like protein (cupin superfamily)